MVDLVDEEKRSDDPVRQSWAGIALHGLQAVWAAQTRNGRASHGMAPALAKCRS